MSTSRLEKFIYAICSMEVSDLPAPLSRIEILWNCLITGETPDFEPQSRNEQYLMAMLGLYELENLPTPMSRGEKLLYKIAMGETDLSDIPAYLSRYEELLGYLAENGGVGDFEYILQTLNQHLSTLYSTKERPMKQAVIKGDTLVNELQRPSLKNTMTNVASQKLNRGYDAVNAVDGEFKSAILKGNTLVNLLRTKYLYCNLPTSEEVEMDSSVNIYDANNNRVKQIDLNQNLQANKKYLIVLNITQLESGKRIAGLSKTTSNEEVYDIPSFNSVGLKYVKYTPKSDVKQVTFYIDFDNENPSVAKMKQPMLMEYQEGMENWDIPYFEGMQSVQLSEVTTTGKNLFDVSKETKNITIDLDYGYANQSTNYRNTSDFIKVTPNTYYISNVTMTRVAYYDKDKKFISSQINASNGITTPTLCVYVRFSYNNSLSNVQFKQCSVATPYEPYQSNTLTLAEPVTLRKVGDVEDEFDALTGQVTERVGEVFFNSSDGWLPNNVVFNNVYEFKYGLPRSCVNFKAISNSFKQAPSGDFERFNTYGNCLYLCINKSKLSSNMLDSLDEYLKSNPLMVQYELTTPTTKQVNPTITNQDEATQTKLHSFNDGHLSVTSQGLLPSSVNYEVPTNNSYYLPDMLTLGAQYTSRGSADCHATIDGKLLALGKNRTFTTPSSVTDRLMVLDAPVDDLMFIKGDQTAKDFGYFEGMKSVILSNKMPVLTTTGKNLFSLQEDELVGYQYDTTTNSFTCFPDGRKWSDVPYVKLIGNQKYTISYDVIKASSNSRIEFNITNGSIPMKELTNIGVQSTTFNIGKDAELRMKFLDGDAVVRNIQVEVGSTATTYEPYKSNILTVNEDVTLRSNGDVYDELNLLTGRLTQRIDENNEVLPQEVVKTVDLTTVDQDGQPTKLKTFNDITHVKINADNLIPSVDLEVATKISETLSTMGPQQLDISNTQNQLGQTIDEQTENTDATMMATTEIYEQTL